MVGVFGDLMFEVSSERVLTFSNFKNDVKARYARHERISQSPILEFLGEDTSKITLDIILTATLGVNPAVEIEKIRLMCVNAEAEWLVIGDSVIGDTRFVITDASIKWTATDGDGKPLVATVSVTFESYQSGVNEL